MLGSALGAACVWPALAFGFSATGFEKLACCVEESQQLATVADPVLQYLAKPVASWEDAAAPAPAIANFVCADVVADAALVAPELADAAVVWSNDYAWPQDVQRKSEELAHASMAPGSVLVLYRPPHLSVGPSGAGEGAWEDGGRLQVPTSWAPQLQMHLAIKR